MKYESRNYEIILYTTEECKRVVNICIEQGFDYAYIKHDKDLKEDLSDFKDVHFHFLIFMPNQRTVSALSKIIGVKENYIQFIKNKRGAIRYLTHADNNDKADYDILNITSNMDLSKYFTNIVSDENVEIQMIIEFISVNRAVSYKALMRFVIDANIWSTYRRNYSIIKDLLYEHNLVFTKGNNVL